MFKSALTVGVSDLVVQENTGFWAVVCREGAHCHQVNFVPLSTVAYYEV